jgi:ferredoxin
VHFAPEVFELDDDGIAAVTADTSLGASDLAATEEAIAAAVAQCPTAAISFDPEE